MSLIAHQLFQFGHGGKDIFSSSLKITCETREDKEYGETDKKTRITGFEPEFLLPVARNCTPFSVHFEV